MSTQHLPFQQAGPAARVSVVYDASDGRVLHIHEFFGAGFEPDECGRMALETVKPLLERLESLGARQPTQVKVLHVPKGFEYRHGEQLRVDVATDELRSVDLS